MERGRKGEGREARTGCEDEDDESNRIEDVCHFDYLFGLCGTGGEERKG